MDEAKLRRSLARGDRARRLIEDELVVEALDTIEKQLIQAWQESRADEEEQRRNAYLMQRLLKNFREHFQKLVRDGDASGKELLRLRDPSALSRLRRK